MKKMLAEFKEFILRGNVLDLAVGIIIGIAFGAIVNSLVNDVIMPPIGRIFGKMDFSSLFINLSGTHYNSLAEAKQAGAAVIAYGAFINTIIKLTNRMTRLAKPKVETPTAPKTKECPFCFSNVPVKATRCPQCTSQIT
jgi:large conductance mechanosensitive channel